MNKQNSSHFLWTSSRLFSIAAESFSR